MLLLADDDDDDDEEEEVLEEALPFLIIKGNDPAYTTSRVASHDVIVGLSL
jgi:hypothetical protein